MPANDDDLLTNCGLTKFILASSYLLSFFRFILLFTQTIANIIREFVLNNIYSSTVLLDFYLSFSLEPVTIRRRDGTGRESFYI